MREIGIGVIGCGGAAWIGHLPWYKMNPNVKLVAVADVNEKRARAARDYFHVDYYYTDYEKLLSRNDIDAVSICTPVHLHAVQTVVALENSKHVLVEKPMARDIIECNHMIKASEKHDRILMVGFMKRFNPAFKYIKEVLARGELGIPYYCDVHWTLFDIRGSEGFRYKAYTGGGVFQDHGSHYIDLIRWWLTDEVIEVSAEFNIMVKGREVEDHGVVLLRFRRGAIATIETSRVGPNHPQYCLWERGQVYCTRGCVLFDAPDWTSYELPLVKVFNGSEWIVKHFFKKGRYPPNHYMFKLEIDHFVDCVMSGRKPLVTGEDGKVVVEVVNAAYLSQLRCERVKLPLDRISIKDINFDDFPRFYVD